MGQTFSADARDFADDNARLSQIQNAISQFGKYDVGDDERNHVDLFKTPLAWKTELSAEQLSSKEAQVTKFSVESFELDDEGSPVFKMDTGSVSCSSFKWLTHVLDKSEDGLKELATILLANKDPLTKILGKGYGGGVDIVDAHKAAGSPAAIANSVATLYSKNREMLCSTENAEPSGYVQYAEAEVKMLKDFSGIDQEAHCLESIDWESSYVSHSGIRAPPWRSSNGDLGYVVVKPFTCESQTIMVSSSSEGDAPGGSCYRIKGHVDGAMDYEKVGSAHKNLVAYLKSIDSHFAAWVAKQDTWYVRPAQAAEADAAGGGADAAATATGGGKTDEETKRAATTAHRRTQRGMDRLMATSSHFGNSVLGGSMTMSGFKGRKGFDPDATGASLGSTALEMEESDDDDEDIEERRAVNHAELPSEYWQIQKLVKYLNSGNQTATIIALCSLRDLDLTKDACQFAIQDLKGLDVLVNLLDAEDHRCKIGALQILRDVSLSPQIIQAIADLDGMRAMVAILDDEDDELKSLAAATIANCAKLSRNRRKILQEGGIEKLVDLLHGAGEDATGAETDDDKAIERSGAMALWSCSKSRTLRQMIMQAGAIPLLANLLASDNIPLLIPVVGIIEECAEDEYFRGTIRELGMIEQIVAGLSVDNEELQAHSASAIFKCAEDELGRQIVLENGGLKPLVALLAKTTNKEMLMGVTGAIWKCALMEESNAVLAQEKAVESLCPLLVDQPEEVLVNVVGALSELAGRPESRKMIRGCGGIDQLVKLLTGTNQELLINVTKAVGECAKDKDNMAAIDKQDGVRLLWSLLKSPTPEVQSGAAWAICPCIELAPDAGEMVRSFVGGLELIVGLLKSEHIEVLASVCAAVANIARDEENLAVMTDYGVVPMLGRLTPTTDDRLRRHLSSAISQCCTWGANRIAFGEADAVAPLVKYLRSADEHVHRSTATALWQLSMYPDNCITMHEAGVVRPLIGLVGSTDIALQEAAAQCLANIRRLALTNELAKYQ